MYGIGIDVGSTFTKYCIISERSEIVECFKEKTPIRQSQYFEHRIKTIEERYKNIKIVSCGYGKRNIDSVMQINELTALAIGANYLKPDIDVILDIGGQDIKAIRQKKGKLFSFFVNDKCAAGSGQFLISTLNQLGKRFEEIKLSCENKSNITLASPCAVFAQSEIVELIAENVKEDDIVQAVVEHIFTQAKSILNKINVEKALISGGFSQISNIEVIAEKILGVECVTLEQGAYLSAIGCALSAVNSTKES